MGRLGVGAALVAASLLLGTCAPPPSQALRSTSREAGAGAGGETCAPVGRTGTAHISFESVRNASSGDVTITGVRTTNDRIAVADWFVVPEDWPSAGVVHTAQRVPAGEALAPTVRSGEQVVVGANLRARGLERRERTLLTIGYDGPGGHAELTLVFRVALVPFGRVCSDPDL